MRFTFRNKCRVKEITPDPRRQQLLAERCGPRPSSTSSALTLPHTDDHRSHILLPLLFKHPRRNSPQYRSTAIGRNSRFDEFANPNSSHYTLRLTHVSSPDQAGLNAGCTGWLAPVKATDMGERNSDQEAHSAATGPDIRPRASTWSPWCGRRRKKRRRQRRNHEELHTRR